MRAIKASRLSSSPAASIALPLQSWITEVQMLYRVAPLSSPLKGYFMAYVVFL
jgi:hypothetical protein